MYVLVSISTMMYDETDLMRPNVRVESTTYTERMTWTFKCVNCYSWLCPCFLWARQVRVLRWLKSRNSICLSFLVYFLFVTSLVIVISMGILGRKCIQCRPVFRFFLVVSLILYMIWISMRLAVRRGIRNRLGVKSSRMYDLMTICLMPCYDYVPEINKKVVHDTEPSVQLVVVQF